MEEIEVGSDFCGVGSFEQALTRLKVKFKTVFACDWDKFARKTYSLVFGTPDYFPEDVNEREIPEKPLDIYMTSPPCQAFCLAGKREGEDDEKGRGILFYNSHNFIKVNKPRAFVFENVKGLLSHDNGRTFRKWIEYLGGKSVNNKTVMFVDENAVPYHIFYKVLNAKYFNVAQSRERIFIVGFRDDVFKGFDFPKNKKVKRKIKDILEKPEEFLSKKEFYNYIKKFFLSEKMVNWLMSHSKKNKEKGHGFNFKTKDPEDVLNTINARCFKMGVDDNYLCEDIIQLNNPKNSTNRVYSEDGILPTLNTMQGGNRQPFIKKGKGIRKLTPKECFRGMDFNEDMIEKVMASDMSATQLYKQAGNSIPVGMLAAVLEQVLLTLKK